MKPEIKAIIDQHKPKTAKDLKKELAYLQSKEWAENWKKEYEAKLQAKEDAVPIEKKRAFIKLFKAGGITLGDAARSVGIDDIDAAARVLERQIKRYGSYIEEIE